MEKILIISDLHLSLLRPETVDLFKKFMQDIAPKADKLYILGDFFDFWIGDDDLSEFHLKIISILKALAATDTEIYFMRGNRDFLIGRRFAHATNATLIGDPTRIEVGKHSYLLMHGDTLCTDDKKYQFYRAIVHNRLLQTIFLLLPLKKRRELALKIREKSKSAQIGVKPADVCLKAVKLTFQYFKLPTLIHGHTHRMKVHKYGDEYTRMVLSDWHTKGSYIEITEDGAQLFKYS